MFIGPQDPLVLSNTAYVITMHLGFFEKNSTRKRLEVNYSSTSLKVFFFGGGEGGVGILSDALGL